MNAPQATQSAFNAAKFDHQNPVEQERKRNCLARYLLTCSEPDKALILRCSGPSLRADIEARMLTEQARKIAQLPSDRATAYWNQYNLKLIHSTGSQRQALAQKRSRLQQAIALIEQQARAAQ